MNSKIVKRSIRNFFLKVWLISKKSFLKFFEDQGLIISNGITFKTLFALIPVIAIIIGMFSLFPYFDTSKKYFLDLINQYISPSEKVNLWLTNALHNTNALGFIGIIIFIYLSLDLFISLDNKIDRMWDTKRKRSLPTKILIYWALLTATPIVLGGYFYYFGLFRSVIVTFTNNSFLNEFLYSLYSILLLEAFLFFLFYAIPNTKVSPIKALIVSVLVSFFWNVVRFIFTYYTGVMIATSKIYGSVAAIIFFMLWINITWIILFVGVEILCVWQNKLYLGNLRIQKFFLFDVGFFVLLLDKFNEDFKKDGMGLTIEDVASEMHYNTKDLKEIFELFENGGFIVGDCNPNQHFYLKKDIASITLDEVESILWNRLTGIGHKNTPKLEEICDRLGNYYFEKTKDTKISLNKIIEVNKDLEGEQK